MIGFLILYKHVSLEALFLYIIHYPSSIFSSQDKWKCSDQMSDDFCQAFALVSTITG